MESYKPLYEVLLGKEPQTLSSKKALKVSHEKERKEEWLKTNYKKYHATIIKLHKHWKEMGVNTHLEDLIKQLEDILGIKKKK